MMLCCFIYVRVYYIFLYFNFFFFFKQKTAYEMRISDWSSDVCSSDLVEYLEDDAGQMARLEPFLDAAAMQLPIIDELRWIESGRSEERRVGKECVRRVDLGGRRIIKKKKTDIRYTIR